MDVISDIVRTVGLLSKETFDSNIGIDNIYVRGLLSQVPALLSIGSKFRDQNDMTLVINIVIVFHISHN